MKTLSVLLAAIVCALAEPPLLFRNDFPHLHRLDNPHFHRLDNPFYNRFPIVRDVLPVGFAGSPYYAGLKSIYYDRDLTGQARYGHVEPGQLHHAVQDAFGNKIGGWSYYNPDGKLVQTSYIADASGYRVTSNDLPLDTPEVQAAKTAHLVEFDKVKSRSRRDLLETPASTTRLATHVPHIDYRLGTGLPQTIFTNPTLPIVRSDGFFAETPEVLATKALRLNAWDPARTGILPSINPLHINPLSHIDYRFTPLPVVRPDGFLADTPEVAVAKARHFAEVAKTKSLVGFI